MRRTILILSLLVVAAFLTESSAHAQQPPQTASMSGAASAHGSGLGVGAVTMLNGSNGAMVTWGSSRFHLDGLFGLRRFNVGGDYTTSFSLGGRFWYHLHAASFADFSMGGGLGIVRWDPDPGNPNVESRVDLTLQVGAQIRAFIVPNVALIADLGLGVFFGAEDDILIGGQSIGGYEAGGTNFVSGTMGIAYFFE